MSRSFPGEATKKPRSGERQEAAPIDGAASFIEKKGGSYTAFAGQDSRSARISELPARQTPEPGFVAVARGPPLSDMTARSNRVNCSAPHGAIAPLFM